jgi:Na+/proline symporter
MLQKSFIGNVLLQVLGVGAYFVLVAILYWSGLTDAGAVAIILGLLFLFKTVVHSGTISIGHLSLSDSGFQIAFLVEVKTAQMGVALAVGEWEKAGAGGAESEVNDVHVCSLL